MFQKPKKIKKICIPIGLPPFFFQKNPSIFAKFDIEKLIFFHPNFHSILIFHFLKMSLN
jgi:hypothetical protein